MRYLFTMWKYPRMTAWFILSTALFIIVRLPFFSVSIIPHYIEFNPGIALVPLLGVLWGPAAVWGAFAASLLGDGLLDTWSSFSIFKAMGMWSLAFTAQRLWDSGAQNAFAGRKHTLSWSSTFHYLHAASAGCFVAAAWTALGADALHFYPFPYVSALVLIHHLIFVNLLGLALYRMSLREFLYEWGTWRTVMEDDYPIYIPSHTASVVLWVAGTGSCVIGWIIGWFFYRMAPLKPYVLGNRCGRGLIISVALLLILHTFMLLKSRRKKEAG